LIETEDFRYDIRRESWHRAVPGRIGPVLGGRSPTKIIGEIVRLASVAMTSDVALRRWPDERLENQSVDSPADDLAGIVPQIDL
jgi:hypothetical protein